VHYSFIFNDNNNSYKEECIVMQQFTQKLKDGSISIIKVPYPVCGQGMVQVHNHFSLISTGTETNTVKTARKGLVGKAKERPQQVKQVLDVLRTQGPVQTYRAVMKKLDAHSPLGYSCAGEVIEVGDGVQEFKVGDKVACGGVTASHAEVVSVPVNLCVKLELDADLKQAAYNTLGAIALQGLRQADLRLGETCAVIGLGLLGQLTGQLLKASGVRTVGVDIDPYMVERAASQGFDEAYTRDTPGIESRIAAFTGEIGCDAVIITAGSSSLDPINFAGAIARKRGTIVVLGAVPTGFDREPHYYKKELQVKMSCSYGPGRYDPLYEDKGIDYPAAYVRWTEKRNMQAFQELLHRKALDIADMTTHTFDIGRAGDAYDLILNRTEPFIGVLISYDTKKPLVDGRVEFDRNQGVRSGSCETATIGFIGAGSYAQSHLLPNMPRNDEVVFKGVMTRKGTSSRSTAERFGFQFCTGNPDDILLNDEINTVFITTRHDTHAAYVLKALAAGKHVFVEKPLCLSIQELDRITDQLALNSESGQPGFTTGPALAPAAADCNDPVELIDSAAVLQDSVEAAKLVNLNRDTPVLFPILFVGYNRRFAPLAAAVKKQCGEGPMAMTYRINAGRVQPDSWIQDAETGGGRIVGEVCHFVDFLTFISGSLPVSVHATAMADANHLHDTVNINLAYRNGSIGTISYLANGDRSLPKERVEVFASGCTAVLDDFKLLTLHSGNKKRQKKLAIQDKGQKAEVREFLKGVRRGTPPPIPYDELISTSFVTFKILESIATGQTIKL
jgi:polar amino acid transport system substrate-binding protein